MTNHLFMSSENEAKNTDDAAMVEWRGENRKFYLARVGELSTQNDDLSKSLDNFMLTYSTWALGLTVGIVSFLLKDAGLKNLAGLTYLKASWSSLVLVIALVMISHWLVIIGNAKSIDKWAKWYKLDTDEKPDVSNVFLSVNWAVLVLTIVLFVVGLSAFCLFFIKNLNF